MARFNQAGTRPAVHSPVTTEAVPSGVTHEGAPGFARDGKSELFLLAVSHMGDGSFYESAPERDRRFRALIHGVAMADPEWIAKFVPWLRNSANMRTASVVAAAEAAKALLIDEKPGGRKIIASALRRADEPGELLAYWHSRYGRAVPKPVKRGLADAVAKLYDEYCVAPDTLVLREDLRWVPARELEEGDSLVGFDERIGVGQGRGLTALRRSAVEHIGRKALPSLRIVTDRGEITVSEGHQFVARHGDRNRKWKLAVDVKAGDKLLWLGEPWPDLGGGNRDAGYAAGLIDGEGWLGGRPGSKRVYFGQLPGFVWDEAIACFKRLGFEARMDVAARGMQRMHIAGGRYESMRFLGQVRPVRLMPRAEETWLGGNMVSKGPHVERGSCLATVLSVEHLGSVEVVTMQTSTRTFIANGFFSHNSLMKYDTASHGYRFGDVIDLCHPDSAEPWRGALYQHALDRRHNRDNAIPEALAMIRANARLRAAAAEAPGALLDPAALKAAGMTWEDALSLAGSKVGKRELWTALIPSMGYMALLRNLRNFDQAGVSDEIAQQVAARLADPEQVARSRQFPFRFLSAYRAVPSLRWSYPLEKALNASLASIPALKGRTLVLIDTSTSMNATLSGGDGTMLRWDAAVLFGAAVAQRCAKADVVSFSGRSYYHEPQVVKARAFPLRAGESLLRTLERWQGDGYFLGGGTDTALALKASFNGHDRVVIVTDEQAANNGTEVSAAVPSRVPLYTWNISGEKFGHAPSGSGNRHTFGGLTDSAFKLIPMLEAGRDSRWDDLFGGTAD